MRMGLALLLTTLLAAPAWAAPALRVEETAGKTIVHATAARLAAWRPAEDILVVVVPAESGGVEIGDLPAGIKAEKLAQGGLVGIVLDGVKGSWQVVQDGANWLLRPGAGLKPESVLMLRDGWRVAGATLKPQTVTAAGKVWNVALVDEARSVAGSVAGAVRVAGKSGFADTVEPPKVAAAPVAPVPARGKVTMEQAPPLRPLAQPMMAAVALPSKLQKDMQGRLRAVNLNEMLARIEPAAGGVASSSLPVLPHAAGLAPLAVTVQPGPVMAPVGVGSPVVDILPQVLGDVYLPGTLVSLTLPGMEEDKAMERQVNAAQALQVSGTWNQTVLGPIGEALAAQEASPTEAASPSVVAAPADDTPADSGAQVALTRVLPARGENYGDAVSDALQAIAVAPDKSTRARDGAMNLAGLYLAWQRPEEALAVISTLPQRADGLPTSPQARLYMALSRIARGDTPEAGLFDQGGQLGGHARLWKAVAASRNGDYATALKIWPQERGILPQYPPYLREMAQMAQATALVMVGDRELAVKVIDELVAGYATPEEVPVGLVRLRGLARLGTKEEAQGLEYLAAAAESLRDPAEAYRAKFQFVRALQQRRDLSDVQVRKYLSDLWFDWRGDDLERDVLNTLADLYDRAGESRDALQYWQTLVKAYPKATDLNEITSRMTEAFLKVFDPENPKIYDTLSYVGLYYDFSELVPNDARGDVVHEQVARMLVDANLWDRAVPILEQQLDHRPLDPAAQGRLALMLAEAYGNLNNAAEGVKVLDKWQKVATTTLLARAWKLAEADLLMKLNRPQAATKALAGLPKEDGEARDRRIEAAWAAQDWRGSVTLLQDRLVNVPASQLVSDTGAQLSVFRLGYAYGQLKDGPSLDALTKRYGTGLTQLPQLADDVGAVAAGTGVSASIVAAGQLAPLTTALNDLNRLTDRVQNVRELMAGQRKEQQEYNDKMRYMELLPPPAI